MKRHFIFYWLIGIVIAGLAVGAAFQFDEAVRDFLSQHQNPTLNALMRGVSRVGDWPAHVALGLLLLGIAWRCGSKKWMRSFLSIFIALALAGVVGRAIKIATARPRPSVKVEQVSHRSRFSSKYHSFPSGHVAASAAFFGVLIFARRRVGLACMAIPVLIGFSRLYIGAHYLSDAVAGLAIGLMCASLVAHWMLPEPKRPISPSRSALGSLCF